MQLLVRHWLFQIEESCGQKKLAITEKGLVFLGKWIELQKLAGLKSKRMHITQISNYQAIRAAYR
jgi:hypothetical protein